jgi:hypothetical protein
VFSRPFPTVYIPTLRQYSTSLEGLTPPRAILRLTRGRPGLVTPCAHSHDQSIKCSGMPRAPGSKANPRHDRPSDTA